MSNSGMHQELRAWNVGQIRHRPPIDSGTAMNRTERIRAALEQAFRPTVLQIEDESHRHAGHAGAAGGRGHFRVEIVSARFAGMKPIERHRAVYAALADLLQTDIHALSIVTRAPEEVSAD